MVPRIAHVLRNSLRRAGFEVVRSSTDSSLLALHLSRLLDAYDINCIIDVGAREGEYGMWLRRNGYSGRIISFEPVQASARALAARADRDPDWFTYDYALGSVETSAKIHVANFTHFSSFRTRSKLSENTFGDESEVVRSETVRVRRLAEVLDEVTSGVLDPRIYLKLDTQGWDLEVLEGAGNRLADVTALQSEVSVQALYDETPSFIESIDRILSLNFVLSGLFPVHVDQRLRLFEMDCVAVRADLPDHLGGAV